VREREKETGRKSTDDIPLGKEGTRARTKDEGEEVSQGGRADGFV
jgi:hypothetical protein